MITWIFFSSYRVNNRLWKGFCFMQLCLCSAPDSCALIHKRHAGHTLMAKIILWAAKCSYAREVFTWSWLCRGSTGREQKSVEIRPERAQRSRRKKQGGHRHDTGLLRPSRAVPCHVAERQQKCHKKPVCLPAWRLQSTALQTNFSLEPLFFLFDVVFFPSSDTSFAS